MRKNSTKIQQSSWSWAGSARTARYNRVLRKWYSMWKRCHERISRDNIDNCFKTTYCFIQISVRWDRKFFTKYIWYGKPSCTAIKGANDNSSNLKAGFFSHRHRFQFFFFTKCKYFFNCLSSYWGRLRWPSAASRACRRRRYPRYPEWHYHCRHRCPSVGKCLITVRRVGDLWKNWLWVLTGFSIGPKQ